MKIPWWADVGLTMCLSAHAALGLAATFTFEHSGPWWTPPITALLFGATAVQLGRFAWRLWQDWREKKGRA